MTTPSSHQTAELNLLWGSLILEELTRLGVEHVCMAPGSRSTPLTLAAAHQNKLKQHLHFDERGLGFLALGLAKASQSPVAIITTSGTAVANLYPAIVEAWLTHVPLIILSGDRPQELIGCGANQAISQPGIFAGYAEQMNLPTPSLDYPPQALLSELDQQVSSISSPLHINCMYREPLYCDTLTQDSLFKLFNDYLAPISWWLDASDAYIKHHTSTREALPSVDEIQAFSQGKGVIVAGTLSCHDSNLELIELAQTLGWPILADAQSQLRHHPLAINHIDQLLHQKQTKALLEQAEHILVFGGRLLSKRLIAYIAEQQWRKYWQVLPHNERLDPSHKPKTLWHSNLKAFASQAWGKSSHAHWAKALTDYNEQMEQLFTDKIDNDKFGEAQVIRALAKQPISQLFIGNSLPVRLFDMFSPRGVASNIYTNRGASGIDGLIATASGLAKHKGDATCIVLGDISALHDLNSLAIAANIDTPFVIVVLNNDGGNIFNLLPVPTEPLRKDYYRLSHGFGFAQGAAMFNLKYQSINYGDEQALKRFNHAVNSGLKQAGTSVIEVKVPHNQASKQIAQLAKLIQEQ